MTGRDRSKRREWLEKARARLFHLLFVMTRPMTFGVRALLHDHESGTVCLIRHTYTPGWQLPGGGVEAGETAEDALRREIREECNVEITGQPQLRSLHFNRQASRRDHVAVYLVQRFDVLGPRPADFEIAEAAFFPINALPGDTTPATRRRIAEILGSVPASPYW